MANVLKIARSFVTKYYKMMAESPDELHKFYKDQSDFIHAITGVTQDSDCHGVDAIREQVAQLKLLGSRVVLTNTDAQQSEYECVIVCVNGNITFSSSPTSQPFVQTFVLAPQQGNGNDTKKSYFVRNSIFRLVNGGTNMPAATSAAAIISAPVPTPDPNPPVVAPARTPTRVPVPVPVPVPVSVPVPVPEPAPAVPVVVALLPTAPSWTPTQDGPVAGSERADKGPASKPPQQSVAEEEKKESPAPTKPEGTKTYASILGAISSGSAVEKTAAPVKVKPVSAPSTDKKVDDSKDKGSGTRDKKEKSNIPSLFINNIDENMTKDTLFSLFSRYGGVGKIDLFPQKGYAFIEYKDPEGPKLVLVAVKNKEPAFVINGKRLGVEEKSGNKRDKDGKHSPNGQANGQRKKSNGGYDKKQSKKV